MKIDLTNKNAVVTGATGELGRTMVRSLAECGANVVLSLCALNVHQGYKINSSLKMDNVVIEMKDC